MLTHTVLAASDAAPAIPVGITSLLRFAMIGIGALLVITGVYRKVTNPYSGGTAPIGAGVMLMMGALLFEPMMNFALDLARMASGESAGAPSSRASATPTPSAPTTPAAASQPVDITGLLNILGVVGAVVLLLALVAGIGWLIHTKVAPSLRAARSVATEQAARLSAAHVELKALLARQAEYATDLRLQIDYPMMTDPADVMVRRFVTAMREALGLRDALPAKPIAEQVARFQASVGDFAASFDAAEQYAHRIAQSRFSVDERRRLKDARILLDQIEDAGLHEAQRNASYRRLAKLLDGLITITEPIRLALAAHVPMLTLEATTSRPKETAR
ncbi:hypothetical protein V6N00_13120 [Tersicoccus sp. MR15.9]|uniref:hypothetical protein n=1 Tax=Tersicoccus mangrovi TaxID=3121635 RepID=UPI002FE68A78